MAISRTHVSYTKLRDGSWGLRGPASQVKAGATVSVRKASGATKVETVGKVLWTGDGVALATIAAAPRAVKSRQSGGGSLRGRRTGCSCGSIEGEYHDWYCSSCRFDELDQ